MLTRIKNATAKIPKLRPLTLDIERWSAAWIEGITVVPPTFTDMINEQSPQKRDQLTDLIVSKIKQVVTIVNRDHAKFDHSGQSTRTKKGRHATIDGLVASLHTVYEGPGEFRTDGPRHDNDHADINDIRIAPTHEELVCHIPPFLPANRYGAPHPHEQGSVQLLQDVQFRLLREELTYVCHLYECFPFLTMLQSIVANFGPGCARGSLFHSQADTAWGRDEEEGRKISRSISTW